MAKGTKIRSKPLLLGFGWVCGIGLLAVLVAVVLGDRATRRDFLVAQHTEALGRFVQSASTNPDARRVARGSVVAGVGAADLSTGLTGNLAGDLTGDLTGGLVGDLTGESGSLAPAALASALVSPTGTPILVAGQPLTIAGTEPLSLELVDAELLRSARASGQAQRLLADDTLLVARRAAAPGREGATGIWVVAGDLRAPFALANRETLAHALPVLAVALLALAANLLWLNVALSPFRALRESLLDPNREGAPVTCEGTGLARELCAAQTRTLRRMGAQTHQLQDDLALLVQMLDDLPLGVAVRDRDGEWALVNDRAKAILGEQAWVNAGVAGGINALFFRQGTDERYPEAELPWNARTAMISDSPVSGGAALGVEGPSKAPVGGPANAADPANAVDSAHAAASKAFAPTQPLTVRDIEVLHDGRRVSLEITTVRLPGVDAPDADRLLLVVRETTTSRQTEAALRADLSELKFALSRKAESLERSVAYSRALFELAPFPMCLSDQDGHLLASNSRFHQLTGRNPDQLEQEIPSHWLSELSRVAYREALQTVADGGTVAPFGVAISLGVGGILPVEVAMSRVLREGRALVLVAIEPPAVGAHQRAEAVDREEVELASRAKTEFLTLMSHEARSPMNAILGMLRLALRTELNARQRNYLEKADRSARLLLGMLDDLADIAQIESGQLPLEEREFSLSEVLASLVDLMAVRAEDAGVEFLVEVEQNVPDRYVGDPLRIYQVLSNLTSNAVDLTPRGGEVRVDIRAVPQSSGYTSLCFQVADTGAGLEPTVIDSIFSEAPDAELASARRYGGIGLGIAICRRLLAHMGGHMQAESKQGEGSIFTVDLELRPGYEGRGPSIPRGTRVLVVDDSPISCEIVQDQLEGMGLFADAVHSGQEALEQITASAARDPYQIVLLDWRMPELDGLEVARQIRAMDGLKQKPRIVMFTAGSERDLREAGADQVLDAILIKPVVPRTLESALLRVLESDVARLVPGPRGVSRGGFASTRSGAQSAVLGDLASTDEHRFEGVRVLVVDDNEVNVELTREILTTRGFEVDAVFDGADAVDRVRAREYDCVLMDIQMPGMDGNAATRQIRAFKTPENLPIIALSASVMEEDRRRALAAGMNDFLCKPLDIPQLFAVLSRWVRLPEGTRPMEGESGSEPSKDVLDAARREALTAAGVAVEDALEVLGGKAELYHKMLVRFREQYRDFSEEFAALIEVGNAEEAARAAHSLKGVAAFSRMPDMQEAARRLERAVVEGDEAGVEAGMAAVRGELERVLPVLESLTAPAPAQDSAAGNVLPFRPS